MDRKATEDTLWIRKRISHVRKKRYAACAGLLLGATVLLLIEMYFIVNLPRVYLVQIILGSSNSRLYLCIHRCLIKGDT